MFDYAVVSRMLDNGNLVGFLLVGKHGNVKSITLKEVEYVGDKIEYLNAEYDPQYKTLVGSHGSSLTNYPAINTEYARISQNGITVLYVVKDSTSKKPVGVVAFNATGMRYNLTFNKLRQLSRTCKNNNYDFTNTKEYGYIPTMQDGTMFPFVEMGIRNTSFNNTQLSAGNTITQACKSDIPVITVTCFSNKSVEDIDKQAQDRLMETMFNMKALTPFYYACLATIIRKSCPGLGTVAVTENTMYYDMEFFASLNVAEMTFLLIHEIMHIAMQHSLRKGNRSDQDLWNIACDLYINSIICNDFGCVYGDDVKEINVNKKRCVIKTPALGVFIETIGEVIDVAVDTPETIYERLLKENNQQSSSSCSNNNNKNSKKNKGEKSSQSSRGDSSSGDSEGDISEGNVEIDDLSEGDGNGEFKQVKNVSVTYNGKKLEGRIIMDVMSNSDNTSKDNEDRNIEDSRKALQRLKTKLKMEEEKAGEPLQKNAGAGADLMERYIDIGLSAGIQWQQLLKNMLKVGHKKTFTLANPNQDYMSLGMTIAGRRAIGKPSRVAGVKFAIDVSGSVSRSELEYYLAEINNIFRFFNLDGELIYWSTMIGDAGNFSNLKDMLKIKPDSTGGTDVRCVFEYLTRVTKVNEKYEPDRVKDIKAVFILTDGCFINNYSDFADAFDRKVIWLVTSNPIVFNPPFGRVIGIEPHS